MRIISQNPLKSHKKEESFPSYYALTPTYTKGIFG